MLELLMPDKDKITDVFLITKKFNSSIEFSQFIERKSKHTNTSCMDILIDYCLGNEIEIESVNKLLTASLKEKIQTEAQDLNLLKNKGSSKLPF